MTEEKLGFIAEHFGYELFDGRTGKKIGTQRADIVKLTCASCHETFGPGTTDEMRAAASEHYQSKHGGTPKHTLKEYPIPDKPIEEGA